MSRAEIKKTRSTCLHVETRLFDFYGARPAIGTEGVLCRWNEIIPVGSWNFAMSKKHIIGAIFEEKFPSKQNTKFVALELKFFYIVKNVVILNVITGESELIITPNQQKTPIEKHR